MEWVERLNSSIKYIEEHLTDEIDYEKLARTAGCSSYHYQRMFVYMAGIPLSEYIRRRKMSLAAVDIKNGEKIIDTALKYGYNSPTAFNRAFQSIHGIAPSAVKTEGAAVRSFPAITFTISIKGAEEMNYRIETKEPFRIVGISVPIAKDLETNFEDVPKKWDEAASDGTLQQLVKLMDTPPMGVLGLCVTNEEQWRYFIAVPSSKNAGDFEEYTVPAATWAVFSGEGTSKSIQELERRIYTEWLPTSGYEYGNAPDVEVYLDPDPANSKFEVWVPVIKK